MQQFTDGQTKSIWYAIAQPAAQANLTGNLQTEVCIIGAGIAGLTTAYLLAKAGKKVTVLEAREIAFGQSGRSTAQMNTWPDDGLVEIENAHGEKTARIVADSFAKAIDLVEKIQREENIECDFERVDDYYFTTLPDEDKKVLLDELAAARRAGIAVEQVTRAPIADFDTGIALRYPNQGQFDPVRYLNGLATAIKRLGGEIYTNTRVYNTKSDGDNGKVTVTTMDDKKVTADFAVVASNSPINDKVTMHTKQSPYRTYVVGLRVPRGSVTKAQYSDTFDPYHYVRLQALPKESNADYDVIITGGNDHKVGQANDSEARYKGLEAWTRQRFPFAGEVEFKWSGQVFEPDDYIAFIGQNPGDYNNVFIITGDSGQGTSHGTIGGMLIHDLIMNTADADWVKVYNPSRKTTLHGGLVENLGEQANVAAQYLDYITPSEVDSIDEIKAGEGALLREGLLKHAIYKDEAGNIHKRSSVCTHLHCVVHWNSGEKSWDCPCHGSRFSPTTGEVLDGPAVYPLSEISE